MSYSTCRARVLFVGFHPLILEDSRLQAGEEYEIHAISAHEDMLLRAIDRIRPNVILLDLLQTGGLRTVRRLRDTSPSCRIVALTGMRHEDIAESLFSAGASGILYRPHVAAELCAAIQTVQSGRRYLSSGFTESPMDAAESHSRSPIQLLASDESVLRLVAKDYPADRIARSLGLPSRVVRRSIAYLKQQLNRRTVRDLKRYAVTHVFTSNSVMRLSQQHPRRHHELPQEKQVCSPGTPSSS